MSNPATAIITLVVQQQQYRWITFLQARQALAARLADPNNIFWTDFENGLYITEALRIWNSLTEVWNADLAFTTSAATWYNLSTLSGSPRLRTLTDSYLYTLMQYHLLEPPTGAGTWSGTSQFALSDLQGALQRRRDEVIQVTGCNLAELPLPSTPNIRRTAFPDTVLEPRRVRFLPASGNPTTLFREDTFAFDKFEPGHLQTPKTPEAWSVITGPPLSMDVDTAPNVAGSYDAIVLQSGGNFAPPLVTLLGVPDDFAWVVKYGALYDLLSRDSEATDRPRAAYCLERYQTGLKIMQASNWLLTATVNGVPVDTPSLKEMDSFSPEWQDDASVWPAVVQAGMDFCAPCPVGPGVGISASLVGNAPVPFADDDFVQASRDIFDVLLDYAQVLACFKMGGSEFFSTKDLEKNFFKAAIDTNKRLKDMGLFRDSIGMEGRRQDIAEPRT